MTVREPEAVTLRTESPLVSRRAEAVGILAGALADLALKKPPVRACGADRPEISAPSGQNPEITEQIAES